MQFFNVCLRGTMVILQTVKLDAEDVKQAILNYVLAKVDDELKGYTPQVVATYGYEDLDGDWQEVYLLNTNGVNFAVNLASNKRV
jgi:hypothetical protein